MNTVKLCECGCGEPAPIAKQSSTKYGYIKGQPKRFVQGHHAAISNHNRKLFDPVEHFWEKVEKVNGPVHPTLGTRCWPWTGRFDKDGYGKVCFKDNAERASRVAFYLTYGRWPEQALHRCDNPPCCNPEHLFEGSNQDNTDDMVAKGRQARGESAGLAKLTSAQVVEIVGRYLGGAYLSLLAQEYGVHFATVAKIVRGEIWTHVTQMDDATTQRCKLQAHLNRQVSASAVCKARTKLTNEQARDIRSAYASGGVVLRQLSEKYGVSIETVWRIVHGHAYTNQEAQPLQLAA